MNYMKEIFSNMLEMMKTRMSAIIYGKRKYSLSTDWADQNFSISYFKFPLPKECKHVQVYYARETIFEYKNLQSMILEYLKLEDMNLISLMDIIIKDIDGWSSFKEITPAMLDTLSKMIARRNDILQYHQNKYKQHLDEFNRYNNDADTLVDNFVMTLFRYSSEIQYSRIFRHFFKKGALDMKSLQKRYDSEIAKLEELMRCIQKIDRVRTFSGKTEEVSIMRRQASIFLSIIHKMTDLVEKDLNFIEEMAKINQIVIAFKVYPYYGREE